VLAYTIIGAGPRHVRDFLFCYTRHSNRLEQKEYHHDIKSKKTFGRGL
jgi:hypothetical protein